MNPQSAIMLNEALAKLSGVTGHRWRKHEFLCTASHCRMTLHTEAPAAATTTIHRFDSATGAEQVMAGSTHSLALVFPNQIDELIRTGETSSEHPVDYAKNAECMEWFTHPIAVTSATLRVRSETIKQMVDLWRKLVLTPVAPSAAPAWMWKAIPTVISTSMVQARRSAHDQRRLLKAALSQRPDRPQVNPKLPYVGPVPKTKDLTPRVLWLMDHLFQTREQWFSLERKLRKSDLARQVFLTLINDGTRGQRRAKVCALTIARMTCDWQLPPVL